MSLKLSQETLDRIPAPVARPRYVRRKVGQAMVHIGVGGFHRAHQAVYADDLLNQGGDPSWGYCGIGLLPHDARMRDVLNAQDCLYTVVERAPGGDAARVIGSITGFLFAPENREAVLEKLASPGTRIISLTITEGGYYIDTNTGSLNATHPDLRRDLEHPHEPLCSFGYLLEAMDRRRKPGGKPVTLMSCDNVQGNGDVLKRNLGAYAEMRDPGLARWIRDNCAFPNSMVDRITPATEPAHVAMVREKFGIADGWPVVTESFRQWVIEDHFACGRPEWEDAGALLTDDVAPYETIKLRVLNGSHQMLCYIGMLLGHEFAHQATTDPDIRLLLALTLDREVTSLLPHVSGVDISDYKKSMFERFGNPAICDQLSRIGSYGSPGMPKFLLRSIEEQLEHGRPIELLSFTVAAWFRFLEGKDERGRELPLKDPMGARLREIALEWKGDPRGLLGVREIFSEKLANSPLFEGHVRKILESFHRIGARATLRQAIAALPLRGV